MSREVMETIPLAAHFNFNGPFTVGKHTPITSDQGVARKVMFAMYVSGKSAARYLGL